MSVCTCYQNSQTHGKDHLYAAANEVSLCCCVIKIPATDSVLVDQKT